MRLRRFLHYSKYGLLLLIVTTTSRSFSYWQSEAPGGMFLLIKLKTLFYQGVEKQKNVIYLEIYGNQISPGRILPSRVLQRGYRNSARLLGESCWPKKWRATWKKLHGNRELAGEWAVGVWMHRDNWLGAQIGASPETKYKRSKIVFTVTSITLSLEHLGTRLFWAYRVFSTPPGTLPAVSSSNPLQIYTLLFGDFVAIHLS